MTFGALSLVLAFAFASFLIELTPGPNMSYLAIVTLREGKRAGAATVAGVALGLAIIGTAAALGFTALIAANPNLYEGLRWAGILFLFYLAYDAWRDPSPEDAGIDKPDSAHFMRGFLTNILNPKAAAFYVTVLPNFIDAERDIPTQTAILTFVYVVMATLVHALIVALAFRLRPFIDGQYKQIVRRSLAVLLALVALWFAIATAR